MDRCLLSPRLPQYLTCPISFSFPPQPSAVGTLINFLNLIKAADVSAEKDTHKHNFWEPTAPSSHPPSEATASSTPGNLLRPSQLRWGILDHSKEAPAWWQLPPEGGGCAGGWGQGRVEVLEKYIGGWPRGTGSGLTQMTREPWKEVLPPPRLRPRKSCTAPFPSGRNSRALASSAQTAPSPKGPDY